MDDWKKNKPHRGKSEYKGLGKGDVGGMWGGANLLALFKNQHETGLVAAMREGKGKRKERPLEIR